MISALSTYVQLALHHHPAFSLPLPPRPRFSREERSTERRTGALRGKSIPELPPPGHSLAYRRPTGGGS